MKIGIGKFWYPYLCRDEKTLACSGQRRCETPRFDSQPRHPFDAKDGLFSIPLQTFSPGSCSLPLIVSLSLVKLQHYRPRNKRLPVILCSSHSALDQIW